MNRINSLLKIFLTLIATSSLSFAGGKGWLNNLDEGLALAKKEGKPVLAEFTGSDWCPPCIMMNKKVFSNPKFVSEASKDYVLVVVDSPRSNPTLAKANEKYFAKYRINSVPSVLLLKANGTEYDRFSASSYDSVGRFLNRIKK